MEISSDYVGTLLKPYHGTVLWRDTMNYAAAINDDNPHYFDDERREGIIAPPMFAVAATWPIIENLPAFIEADDFPQEVLLTLVHYTEHIRFHRPLIPGQTLSIQGRVAAILPHRAGTQIVTCFDARDQNNQPVFTEYNGGMLRGVQSLDGASGADALPAVPEREPQAKLRLKGHGLPSGPHAGRGDLFVRVGVDIPKELNDEQRATIEKLQEFGL